MTNIPAFITGTRHHLCRTGKAVDQNLSAPLAHQPTPGRGEAGNEQSAAAPGENRGVVSLPLHAQRERLHEPLGKFDMYLLELGGPQGPT